MIQALNMGDVVRGASTIPMLRRARPYGGDEPKRRDCWIQGVGLDGSANGSFDTYYLPGLTLAEAEQIVGILPVCPQSDEPENFCPPQLGLVGGGAIARLESGDHVLWPSGVKTDLEGAITWLRGAF
jgi:hypothetical protein